ncbi:glycosyltransferase [Pseudomonas sp. NPDC077649]|uniref:glycosyltransferase n=1 Tax=Pseudomonas sp. NPDC077649 TaxID=3364423 RepID=UPI0037C8A9D4
MRILVYSETSATNLQSRLGTAEYSYFFVLREFIPVLESLGDVQVVEHPEDEVDAVYLDCSRRGEPCVFLSFSPPHRTLLNLQCPTIPVFAWEFDSIPHETWLGRPEEDWGWVLRQLGQAITHSISTVRAAYRVLEPDYPLLNVPAPVWDTFGCLRDSKRYSGSWQVQGRGTIFDTGVLDLSMFLRASPGHWHAVVHGLPTPHDDPELESSIRNELDVIHRRFTASDLSPEEQPMAPRLPSEGQQLVIPAPGLPARKRIFDRQWWKIGKRYAMAWYLGVAVPRRASQAGEPAQPEPLPESVPDDSVPLALFQSASFALELDGVVFTSVFNPYDGRKNWQDMLSAFCSAFSDKEDAVLLFKLTHRACTQPIVEMLRYLARLPAFSCRVILLHGYLDDTDYQAMVSATAYVVNASYGEGQCLPLMEFLSCGKPAIAPKHSGMVDYIDECMAFVVDSWDEATGWPHDPRFATRTCRQQVSWTSLRNAFTEAYHAYLNEPDRYMAMSDYAIERMRQHCSREVVKGKLKPFLEAAACA